MLFLAAKYVYGCYIHVFFQNGTDNWNWYFVIMFLGGIKIGICTKGDWNLYNVIDPMSECQCIDTCGAI